MKMQEIIGRFAQKHHFFWRSTHVCALCRADVMSLDVVQPCWLRGGLRAALFRASPRKKQEHHKEDEENDDDGFCA